MSFSFVTKNLFIENHFEEILREIHEAMDRISYRRKQGSLHGIKVFIEDR